MKILYILLFLHYVLPSVCTSGILLVCLTVPLGQSVALFAPLPSLLEFSFFCGDYPSWTGGLCWHVIVAHRRRSQKQPLVSGQFGILFLGRSLVRDWVTPSECRPVCLSHIRLLWCSLFGRSTDAAMDLYYTGVSHVRQLNYLTLFLSLHSAHLLHLII